MMSPSSRKPEPGSAKARALVMCQQRGWAESANLKVDARGYVPSIDHNLFRPLSIAARADFAAARGSELKPKAGESPKMCALHSSSALVCNVFDYWQLVDQRAIARLLGIASPEVDVRFEAELSSGLQGTKPTLDLLLVGSGSQAWGIESKFTEPFGHSQLRPPFQKSYFAPPEGRWKTLGLPACQKLAEDLRDGVEVFKYVEAPQLLKHVLGLRRQYREAQLVLLWFQVDAEESEAFATEIDRFAEAVDESLGFRAITYQDVFGRIAEEPAATPEYRAYLQARYFPSQSYFPSSKG